MTLNFVGKGVLIEENSLRVLVIGDLHLGYGESLQNQGYLFPTRLKEDMMQELSLLLEHVGRVDKIIFLGDLKHDFGSISREERESMTRVLDLTQAYCSEIVMVKGNHDKVLNFLIGERAVTVCDYYIWNQYVFLHGDRDFPSLYEEAITTWIVGHAHPAVGLTEGAKHEKYKCFLRIPYNKKEIIVVPSFFLVSEGSDILLEPLLLVWPVNLRKARVYIVGEAFEVFDFGLVSRIRTG